MHRKGKSLSRHVPFLHTVNQLTTPYHVASQKRFEISQKYIYAPTHKFKDLSIRGYKIKSEIQPQCSNRTKHKLNQSPFPCSDGKKKTLKLTKLTTRAHLPSFLPSFIHLVSRLFLPSCMHAFTHRSIIRVRQSTGPPLSSAVEVAICHFSSSRTRADWKGKRLKTGKENDSRQGRKTTQDRKDKLGPPKLAIISSCTATQGARSVSFRPKNKQVKE